MYSEMAAAMRRFAAQLADDVQRFGITDARRIREIIGDPLQYAHRALPGSDESATRSVLAAVDTLGIPGTHLPGATAVTPRIFRDAEEAHAYGTRTWGAVADRLDPAQRQLLWEYTRGDSTLINDLLREGIPLWPGVRERAAGLDAIVGLQATHEWVQVTKTIQAGRLFPDRGITEVTPGYRGTFRDFVSTSMYPGGVNGLKNVEGRNVDATIAVPPGTPAFYVGDLSATPEEKELLLGRGLDFDLTDLQPDGDRWQAAVTILPP
ncbi:ADP-ribosyltransferase [Nocardia fusca]|uniref:ADP-ribosyltransferase n=1 Tax=Nocardia fusca TaxID=941183 RepID=UPI000AC23986|nr:ADP-ribosyltransferase [Nocardia fusca]